MKEVETSPAMKSSSSRTAWERNIGADSANPELSQRPPGARDRRLEGPSAGNELDQHGVEVGADLYADVDGPTVEADARSTGGSVRGDRAGVGPEAVGRSSVVIRHCRAVPLIRITSWEKTKITQALARGNAHLGLHEIDVGDLFGDGVLDLDRGFISMKTCWPYAALRFRSRTPRARAGVVDRFGKAHRVAARRLSQLGRNVWSRRDFHDLLVPPLDRAIARTDGWCCPACLRGSAPRCAAGGPCSINAVGSPNAPSAHSRMAAVRDSRSILGSSTPAHAAAAAPATALTNTGKPISSAPATSSSTFADGGVDLRVGTPAALAAWRARTLLPAVQEPRQAGR